jgi:hypothetical protein
VTGNDTGDRSRRGSDVPHVRAGDDGDEHVQPLRAARLHGRRQSSGGERLAHEQRSRDDDVERRTLRRVQIDHEVIR